MFDSREQERNREYVVVNGDHGIGNCRKRGRGNAKV